MVLGIMALIDEWKKCNITVFSSLLASPKKIPTNCPFRSNLFHSIHYGARTYKHTHDNDDRSNEFRAADGALHRYAVAFQRTTFADVPSVRIARALFG